MSLVPAFYTTVPNAMRGRRCALPPNPPPAFEPWDVLQIRRKNPGNQIHMNEKYKSSMLDSPSRIAQLEWQPNAKTNGEQPTLLFNLMCEVQGHYSWASGEQTLGTGSSSTRWYAPGSLGRRLQPSCDWHWEIMELKSLWGFNFPWIFRSSE